MTRFPLRSVGRFGDRPPSMPGPYAAFGMELRALRQRQGLRQADVAAAARLNRAHLGLLEQGHKRPKPATVERLAAVLGADAAELLRLLETPQTVA